MIYENSETLPAFNFFKIVETNDFSYMFENNKVESTIDAESVFNNISDEINEILGTKNDFSSFNNINKLKYKHLILTNAIEILSNRIDFYYIEWCKKNGYKFDISNGDTYRESIENLLRQSKSLAQKINLKVNELSESQKKTKLDMYQLNTQVEKHFKFNLDMKKICIKQYANYIIDYKKSTK